MQEMVIVGLLFLVIFGPSKLPAMARDIGRFVSEARRSIEEFKEDLVSEEKGGQEPRKGRDPETGGESEENVWREEGPAIDSSAQRTEQLQSNASNNRLMCLGKGTLKGSALLSALIHRSAWKACSPNFVCRGFWEVRLCVALRA